MDLYEVEDVELYELNDKDLYNVYSTLNPLSRNTNTQRIVDTSTITLPIFYRGVDSKIGNYTITEVIGISGFSTLYIAIDNNAEDLVLIKEYFPDFSTLINMRDNTFSMPRISKDTPYPMGVHYYSIEAKHFNAYYDANSIKIRDFFIEDEAIFTVLEYKQSVSLQYYIEQLGPLKEDVIKKLIYPAISSLLLLHEQDILHGRINPGNVLLFDNILPVIKYFNDEKNKAEEKDSSVFISPDLYLEKSQHGPWADIYSLGATLYYCVTGKAPVAADVRNSAIAKGDEDPYVEISLLCSSSIHKSLLKAIDWMLNLSRRSRPASVQMIRSVFSPYYNLQESEFVKTSDSFVEIDKDSILTEHHIPKAKKSGADIVEEIIQKREAEDVAATELDAEDYPVENEDEIDDSNLAFLDTSIVDKLERELADKLVANMPSSKEDKQVKQTPNVVQDTVSRHVRFVLSPYDSAILTAQLSRFIGPIATYVIDECYSNATNRAMFFKLLDRSLDSANERKAFHKALEQNNLTIKTNIKQENSFEKERHQGTTEILNNPQMIDELKQTLRLHIGPIADILINKAMMQKHSFEEIIDSLSEEIQGKEQQRKFCDQFRAYLK